MASDIVGFCDSCLRRIRTTDRYYHIRFPYDQYLLCDHCVTPMGAPKESESGTGKENEA